MRKQWVAATMVVVALILTGCGIGGDNTGERMSNDELARQVEQSMDSRLRDDPNLSGYRIDISNVWLVHSSGNEYKGVAKATARISGVSRNVPVTVTSEDGKLILWETPPGAFAFVTWGLPANDDGA